MANLTIVPLLTPVETEHQWTSWPARFISPLFCTKEVAVLQSDEAGARICEPKKYETKAAITAMKVFAWLASAGIALLVACVVAIVVRCVSGPFHYAVSRPARSDSDVEAEEAPPDICEGDPLEVGMGAADS